MLFRQNKFLVTNCSHYSFGNSGLKAGAAVQVLCPGEVGGVDCRGGTLQEGSNGSKITLVAQEIRLHLFVFVYFLSNLLNKNLQTRFLSEICGLNFLVENNLKYF